MRWSVDFKTMETVKNCKKNNWVSQLISIPTTRAGNFNTFIYLLRKIDTIKHQSSNFLSPKKMPWSCGFDEERFMVLIDGRRLFNVFHNH